MLNPNLNPNRRRALEKIAASACLASLGAVFLAGCGPAAAKFQGVDVTGADYGRDLPLPDQDGRQRTLSDFAGKVVVAFFGYTQCPDVCPTAMSELAEVKRSLGADSERVQGVFVTVDPERDTPEVLKAYTAAFDPSFIGLYGDLERTAQIAKDFKVYYKKMPTGSSYTMDHTSLSYVYDPLGKLRLALRHEQPAQDYADDIRKLLNPA